ncbi:unnamed protein product [Ceratitis capitata]|uniref:(Mediterranean fruit fly) hypothetical protein n=1 Tax=Ceratitis capitata TaxID=7213 RepID=A0A811VIT9_CERCA|nr:unnamed protein product [Ceratitis capitata]
MTSKERNFAATTNTEQQIPQASSAITVILETVIADAEKLAKFVRRRHRGGVLCGVSQWRSGKPRQKQLLGCHKNYLGNSLESTEAKESI